MADTQNTYDNESPLSSTSLFSVAELITVVTGGGTGIGLMIARALEMNGAAKVYIIGRRRDVLENAAKQGKFGRIIPVVCDVTVKEQLSALAERITQESGRVDVLVNNAAVMTEKHTSVALNSVEALQELFWQESPENWSKQFEVNVTAAFFTTVAFMKLLKNANEHWKAVTQNHNGGTSAQRYSQVISLTGIAAHHRAMAGFAGYAASKAALLHLMKTLGTVLAPLDIRFNMISPGLFPTEITAGKGHLDSQNRNIIPPVGKSQVPQGRSGDEKDISGAILYLCGRGGWYCNGMEVITDGGRLSISPSTY